MTFCGEIKTKRERETKGASLFSILLLSSKDYLYKFLDLCTAFGVTAKEYFHRYIR